LEGAQPYSDANTALMAMMTPPAAKEQAPKQAVGGEAGQVGAIFKDMAAHFQPGAAAGLDVVFQFSISGSGGGDWFVIIKEGKCEVGEGVHSQPTTTIRMSDEDFLKYIGRQLPAMQAYSAGKLKIEGDLMKSQLIEKLFKF
jgi:putative sterol carrier protein